MEGKSINRFRSFCNCLEHLRKSVSADPKEDFVLEGTVLMFMLESDEGYFNERAWDFGICNRISTGNA